MADNKGTPKGAADESKPGEDQKEGEPAAPATGPPDTYGADVPVVQEWDRDRSTVEIVHPVDRTPRVTQPSSFREKSGVDLSQRLICIVAAVAISMIAFSVFLEYQGATRERGAQAALLAQASSTTGPETARIKALRNLMKDIEANRQNERAHVIALTQLLLVNVLLPVLTGLLGYIFGTGAASQPAPPTKQDT